MSFRRSRRSGSPRHRPPQRRPADAAGARKGAAPPQIVAPDEPSAPHPSAAADPLVGRVIAGHQVLQRVATGRLCSIYKANHAAMGRLVALKVLSADAGQTTVERFHKTARYAARLHHANIASIYDVNTDGGVHFCAMEYVEGQTLGELFRAHHRLPTADAIRVAIDVAEALRFGNAKGVPGWRLSANRLVITRRGEVKLLPPTFGAPNAPVLDDRYVNVAVGVLLYAMLTGGRVRDIEYALEPGSKAPRQLEPIRNVTSGIRRDVARTVERLVGISGEPYSSADAAITALRNLLVAKEELESRARSASERQRARAERTRTGLYLAIGAVAAAGLVLIGLLVARSSARATAAASFNEAAATATACFKAFAEDQKQFLANPSQALAQRAVAHLEKARAAYAAVAQRHPNDPKGIAAAQNAKSIAGEIQKFRAVARAELRHAEAKGRLRDVEKALEAEIARRLEQGGQFDVEAWKQRYRDIARQYADSPKTVEYVRSAIRSLPQRLLREQMKADTNAVANEVKAKYLPNNLFGKAIEAWNAYRQKYSRSVSDATRREVLKNYDAKTTEIRRLARLQYAKLNQQAKYYIGRNEYDKAREIYNNIIETFGILEYVDRAKEALAKLPKQ